VSVWRLLQEDGVGAADGLAVDEALMLHYGRGETARGEATLRLYTYRPHAVLVGRYQVLDAEVDREACERRGFGIGRRPTGGGAIIMGPGQLGVAIATRAPAGVSPRELLRQYAAGITAGLAGLGVDAAFRGKNDIEVGGRKLGGLGLYVDDRGALLFHASILADLDVELMLEVLRIPGAKLADKGVERVHERITTVSRELGSSLDAAMLREAITAGFAQRLELELDDSRLDAREAQRARELSAERYGSAAWVGGRAPAGDTHGTVAVKTELGLIRAYVGVQDSSLSSVLIAGDFSVMPPELTRLEAALRWCRADPERIERVVADELSGSGLELDPALVARVLWGAAERALERSAGASPVRAAGSCYFPAPQVASVLTPDASEEAYERHHG
jgi:lipoate-protein ligase A